MKFFFVFRNKGQENVQHGHNMVLEIGLRKQLLNQGILDLFIDWIAFKNFVFKFFARSRIPGLSTGEEFCQPTMIKSLHLAGAIPNINLTRKVRCNFNTNKSNKKYFLSKLCSVELYNFETKEWQSDETWRTVLGRLHASSISFGDKVIVFGGQIGPMLFTDLIG